MAILELFQRPLVCQVIFWLTLSNRFGFELEQLALLRSEWRDPLQLRVEEGGSSQSVRDFKVVGHDQR